MLFNRRVLVIFLSFNFDQDQLSQLCSSFESPMNSPEKALLSNKETNCGSLAKLYQKRLKKNAQTIIFWH